MRLDTLNERIENAKAKIEKKQNTIEKKLALIEKKREKIVKLGGDPDGDKMQNRDNQDVYWTLCEIGYLKEDIERGKREIEETKASLEKYEKQLTGELEKEAVLLKEVPESMRRMQEELTERWTAWDIEKREQIKSDRREMDYKSFCKKWNVRDRMDFMYLTDEQIRKSNEQDAKCMVLNLYYRVKHITGEVTDWSGIHCAGVALNGFVVGKEGRAEVESILAGGWNIQRLHVRTLVHER